ncbi:proteinase inhibitor [Striga asiatica]|uniref:Proteinase inhibitor n=1 Tax=Striga asiatica TaxID=4170 RepID=A0A5A7NYN8_STRAF|nr:proteinase inhibitor [Striga asiatica]
MLAFLYQCFLGFVNAVGVGKSSWPELVGQNGNFAEAVIERENPNVDAIVVLDGSYGTTDFRCDRVRVPVNQSGIVVPLEIELELEYHELDLGSARFIYNPTSNDRTMD